MIVAIFLSFVISLFSHPVQSGEIDSRKKEIAAITEKEKKIIDELHNLGLTLDRARKKTSLLKEEVTELEANIHQNTAKLNDLKGQIGLNEEYASRRLVALYKLHQLGKFSLLASADSVYAFFHRKAIFEKILANDEAVLNELLNNRNRVQAVIQDLKIQKAEHAKLEHDLSLQIKAISEKKEQRAAILKKIRNKKSLALAAIESLKESADMLNDKISGFKKEYPDQKPYAKSSPHAFTDLKGLLIMPVKGKIVQFFGPYTNTKFNIVNFRSGVKIEAERGEPIHAVYKGVTLYADWFKGYGNLIIVDHGDHYYTLYAHAEELFKKKGDPVDAGEVIATVGDSESLIGPGLHFEVRHHGKPVDPAPWINRG